MVQALPIRFEEHLQLMKLGIKPNSIRFHSVTMESERFITVVDKAGDTSQVVIVDLQQRERVVRRQLTGDHVTMNPVSGILAVRHTANNESTSIELFDPELKCRLKTYTMRCEVVFWKWVSVSTLALVTLNSVFHWTLDADTNPVRMFQRCPATVSHQVIDYKSDPGLAWLVIIGLSTDRDRVVGKIQLYSVERQCSQLIDGHSACFARFRFNGSVEDSDLLCFTCSGPQPHQTKLHVVELGRTPQVTNNSLVKKNVDMFFTNETANDFPVAMQSGSKYGVIYIVTKFGYIYIYDVESLTCLYVNRISAETIFVTAPYETLGGIVGVNRKGQVLSVSIDESQIILYIKNVLKNSDLALRFAARNSLQGAEEEFSLKFNELFDKREYTEAAKIAAIAPGGVLRTPEILQKFQKANSVAGQISPVLQFFGTLLDHGQLNKHESLELCRPVLLQGKKDLLEKWLVQNKLECSEELGNLVKNIDINLALSVYIRASIPNKVVECFAECGQFEKIFHYAEKVNYNPDYLFLLKNTTSTNPSKGLEFAKIILKEKKVDDLDQIVNIFTERSLIQECTAFLLEALKNNLHSEGYLQTKLLEMNLVYAPQVADAILGNQMFSYYDRHRIAELCEKCSLYKRALEHYTDLEDIKRVIVRTDFLEIEWLVSYFGTLKVDDSIQCLRTLLVANPQSNLNICLQIAIRYYKQLTLSVVVELFESLKSADGLFCFLGAIINDCQDEEIHFKYIKAACELGQMAIVENICKTSNYYCPEKVKNYLKEAKIIDHMALVIVCDRFNFVYDLIFFLFTNNSNKLIETYVKNVNPSKLPVVVGYLLDLDCSEEFVKQLISEVQGPFSVEELVKETEKRNRLLLLLLWLEDKDRKGCTEIALHNALGKIYIDTNSNPEKFLKENKFYDSHIIGEYCEARNPNLAAIAYERGQCDSELVRLFKENSMFKQAAKFIVERKKPELWAEVLNEDTLFRKSLINQIINSALLESRDPSEVSETVKAFMAADLLNELVNLLDKLIGENASFSEEANLQNLIILTAIKVDRPKVMDFIEKFDNYSAEEIANIAVNNDLYDEALAIYKKFHINDSALSILINQKENLEDGLEFALACNEPSVWTILGQAQLQRGLIKDSINSFLRAENPISCGEVIKAAQSAEEWEYLLKYLHMAVKINRNPFTESELVYVFARTGKLRELEDFISVPNNVDINRIGDRCFEHKLYEAAKLLYNNSSNFSNLAITLICLKDFQGAVESARKANKISTWKEVCFACIDANEFRYAQMCALRIVIHADELDTLTNYYEWRGYFTELICVLEVSLSQERAHMGMFTQLAILYAKYKPDKMKDYLDLFWTRLNIPKVVRATEEAHLWQELVLLYDKYEHFDNALAIMLDHPTEAWKEGYFNDIVLKVSNHQLHLKAVQFYLEFKPLLLNSFLITLASKLDNSKVVSYISEKGCIQMAKPYLHSVQYLNDKTINEALNTILIYEEDYERLKKSIESYDNFDLTEMALRLEKSELLEMRRIAGMLYRKSKSWRRSTELFKENGLFREAMETAAESGSRELAEELAEWFLALKKRDCFGAALLTCYELLQPDVVLELAWRHDALDLAMPFLVQATRDLVLKVDCLSEQFLKERNKESTERHIERTNTKCLPYFSPGLDMTSLR